MPREASKKIIRKKVERTEARKKLRKIPRKINLKTITNSSSSKGQYPRKVSRAKRVKTNKKLVKKGRLKKRKQKLESEITKISNKTKLQRNKNISGNDLLNEQIVIERNEQDKRFLMWTAVSFFMILIAIFWFYSTKENIKEANYKWESSQSAANWSRMSNNLDKQILSLKENMKSFQSFASSSKQQNLQMINDSTVSTTSNEMIRKLKHRLESKIDSNNPSKEDYYFILGNENLKKLLANLKNIKIGDSLSSIKKILNEADFEQDIRDKRGAFVAKVLSYYVKIYQKDVVNEKYDRYIRLEFDQNDKLTKINKILD